MSLLCAASQSSFTISLRNGVSIIEYARSQDSIVGPVAPLQFARLFTLVRVSNIAKPSWCFVVIANIFMPLSLKTAIHVFASKPVGFHVLYKLLYFSRSSNDIFRKGQDSAPRCHME